MNLTRKATLLALATAITTTAMATDWTGSITTTLGFDQTHGKGLDSVTPKTTANLTYGNFFTSFASNLVSNHGTSSQAYSDLDLTVGYNAKVGEWTVTPKVIIDLRERHSKYVLNSGIPSVQKAGEDDHKVTGEVLFNRPLNDKTTYTGMVDGWYRENIDGGKNDEKGADTSHAINYKLTDKISYDGKVGYGFLEETNMNDHKGTWYVNNGLSYQITPSLKAGLTGNYEGSTYLGDYSGGTKPNYDKFAVAATASNTRTVGNLGDLNLSASADLVVWDLQAGEMLKGKDESLNNITYSAGLSKTINDKWSYALNASRTEDREYIDADKVWDTTFRASADANVKYNVTEKTYVKPTVAYQEDTGWDGGDDFVSYRVGLGYRFTSNLGLDYTLANKDFHGSTSSRDSVWSHNWSLGYTF